MVRKEVYVSNLEKEADCKKIRGVRIFKIENLGKYNQRIQHELWKFSPGIFFKYKALTV